jgi:hypothetical protein
MALAGPAPKVVLEAVYDWYWTADTLQPAQFGPPRDPTPRLRTRGRRYD